MARSHKYIRREGAPKQYHYIYQEPGKTFKMDVEDASKVLRDLETQGKKGSEEWLNAVEDWKDALDQPEGKTFKMEGPVKPLFTRHIILQRDVPVLPMSRAVKKPTKFVIQQPVRSEAWERADKLFKPEGKTFKMEEAPRHIILEGGPNRRLKPEEKARESLKTYSGPHTPLYLDSKAKKNINDMIAPMVKEYQNEIPLKDIFGVLSKHGVVPLQEDNTEWSGFLIGREGHMNLPLAPFGTRSPEKEFEHSYKPFKNATLSVSWYKLESGRYEVLSHVS